MGYPQTFSTYPLVSTSGQRLNTKVNNRCKSRAKRNVRRSAERDLYRFIDSGEVRRGGSALRRLTRAAPGPARHRGGARAGRTGVAAPQRSLERPLTGVPARAVPGRPPGPRERSEAPRHNACQTGTRRASLSPRNCLATEGYLARTNRKPHETYAPTRATIADGRDG